MGSVSPDHDEDKNEFSKSNKSENQGSEEDVATTSPGDREQIRKDLEKKIGFVTSWVNTAMENGLFSEISKKTEIKEVKKE